MTGLWTCPALLGTSLHFLTLTLWNLHSLPKPEIPPITTKCYTTMMSRERPKWEQPFVKHRPHTLLGSCRRDSTVMSLWPRRTPPPLDQPRVELRLRAASTSSSSRSCRRGRVKLVEVLLLSLMSLRPHRTPPPLAHVAEAVSSSSSSRSCR